MKKNGFTLAEVLISLTIIGVVAALSAPALIQDISNARLGPTLAKFKSTMENANRAIMHESNSVDLSAIFNINANQNPDYTNYVVELTNHLTGSRTLLQDNNIDYCPNNFINPGQCDAQFVQAPKLRMSDHSLVIFDRPTNDIGGVPDPNSNYIGPFSVVYIDIDGEEHGQNSMGLDVFSFLIDRNGSLIPVGSTAFATYDRGQFNNARHWNSNNQMFGCNGDSVNITGDGCAGSIFDNNQKVIYK